jgi:hypothetical protein
MHPALAQIYALYSISRAFSHIGTTAYETASNTWIVQRSPCPAPRHADVSRSSSPSGNSAPHP